jgi:hypothetical protein
MNRFLVLALICAVVLPTSASAEFGVGLSVGGYTGDRLYSATSVNPRIWENPTGQFSTSGTELLVDMESWAQFGLTGFTTLRDRWGLRFDLSFTDVDVDGKVRDESGTSETLGWDQLFVFDVVAQATYRIGRSDDTYPWIGLGPSFTVMSGEGDSLDQTTPGLAWGAGWRISALENSWLELGVRGILQWPDWSEEEDRLAADNFEGESMIHSLSAAISVGRVF